ncbi:hypothetical protein ASU31_00525 [Pedobacter ginsenosidimutans]|uniref:Thioredoxin domain-containing protein n=1 Tax=Pedobacter ginsenosidimutans TaxID=687842 RepID=A0A0T5VW04_9SPHI|nr:TlpA disulfide reductase family protein [Pedobacter ginsenosidimutans]KRT17817.1 hypothetical protein ASU31_00525 [Pedobacter ginsenosidimutans]
MVIDTSSIVAGKAKITGNIIRQNNANKDSIFVNINVPHPISGDYAKYKALVDQSGKFSINVDVETVVCLTGFSVSLNPEKFLTVKLTNARVTNVNITYDENNNIKNIDVIPAMNQYDMTEGLVVHGKAFDYRSGKKAEPLYNKSTDYFLNYAKTDLSERLEIVNNDTLISKELKGILSKDLSLYIYSLLVFDYENIMIFNYKETNGVPNNKNSDQIKIPHIQKIDRTYFHFLKDFNLNDTEYLHCFNFLEFQKVFLQNETLNLPKIVDSDIPSWLKNVKAILADLVGFDNGQYYDILVANAYALQLNEELKPLTEKQKENIKKYWKNGEIAKILFRKNQQVIEFDKFKSPVVVNDVSSVPDNKVIEKIIAKHKGKVVLIDLWATRCGPCLEAMQQFRSTKGNFHDKDVAFVYLTNESSPRKKWEEKIKGIGDEHYYLKGAQWEYIMNQFEFEYIPSYLLYNKEGVLINKFQAFPGSDKVKVMINGLL